MSVDQDFGPRLRIWLHERLAERPDPYPILDDVMSQLPSTPQQRSWRPVRIPAQQTMWSTAKSIVAISIVAVFGGVLLFGILTAPAVDEALPAATGSPSPMTTDRPAFPTGTFEAAEDGLTLVLRADGICERADVPCTFGVTGNVYSEMTFEDPSGAQVPATYYWDFDGDYLTFDSWGTDQRPDREEAYAERTYRLVEAAEPLPSTAETGFPTGVFVPADGSDAPLLSLRKNGTVAGAGIVGKYAVNGDLYTEMRHNSPIAAKVPATYRWGWDGERLSFSLWGEDGNAARKALYAGHVYVRQQSSLGDIRRLLLSHPQLDLWATVEVRELDDGRYEATATIDEDPLGEGIGDTLQEAVEAALEALGEPYASDMAGSVQD